MTATVEVLDTDITTLEVDAIANAANTRLLHGGGVAGAIARAGGPAIQEESDRRGADRPRRGGRDDRAATCPRAGSSTPRRWSSAGPTSADIIRRATAATLWKAEELGARSLALVAFGTGVGGFPLDEAAAIEVEEVRRHLDGRQPAWSASSSPCAARPRAARSSAPWRRST